MDQPTKANPHLSEEQYNVCFLKGTEPPFSGKFNDHHEIGMYVCANCGHDLFSSDTKFDSGTGWPSFYDVAREGNISIEKDYDSGMVRDEALCANCGAHLGHVFPDGPRALPDGRQATGERYCINSLALDFRPAQQ